MKYIPSLVPVAALFLAIPAVAQPIDIGRGRALAETWCVNCHVIDRDQTTSVPIGPPPFPELADNPDATPDRLASFIQMPHPPMPTMSLTNSEVNDLVGYIQSLKR